MYNACCNPTDVGPARWAWPDGRSLVEQPALAVTMFGIISEMVYNEIRQTRGK